ncbi:hypothetical protein A9Q99_14005 [Gammaproteobacteria bacterium 45_16_T64]|nr:hypothetical protein A9Q99_14005 [Gammaproteobacteria bacterium 45_16_T64]
MNADSILSLKCPSCGGRQLKTLSAIKAQQVFNCECGYHADLQPKTALKPRSSQQTVQAPDSVPLEKEEAHAITA